MDLRDSKVFIMSAELELQCTIGTHQASSLVALVTTLIVGNADMLVFPSWRWCR